MREWVLRNAILQQIAVTVAIGLVLGTIGPFGTFTELSAADRYTYWLSIVVINWFQISIFSRGIARLRFADRLPRLAIAALACVVASIPATIEVIWLEQYFRPHHLIHPDHGPPTTLLLYGYVVMLSLVISLPLAHRLVPRPRTDEQRSDQSGPPVHFLERIPTRLGKKLLCVEAADHYLRVHTPLGDDLVLFRMSDALAELATADGLRVHRSFWIARDAVVAAKRNGGKYHLKLSNGLSVPISRSYLGTVRKAGWLVDGGRRVRSQASETAEPTAPDR